MARGRTLGLAAAICALATLFWTGSAAAAGGEIHGTVTDHLGDPIAGVTVCAEGLEMFVGNECDWATDAEGKYSIGGLEASTYRVGFYVEGDRSLNYFPQWYNGQAHPEEADPVQLASGESREIDAQMQAGGEVHGTVADVETGDPIEGVRVCANSVDFFQTGELGYCGESDAQGEFTVRNLGTGNYRLEFQTEGQVNYVEEELPQAPGSIHLTAPGVLEIEAHLVAGVKIEGTLTEAGTGAPIEGLPAPHSTPAVCALDQTTQERVKCASVGTGGHYSIAGLPAGTYAVSFAVDWIDDGFDLHPDGYVRRYWNEVPAFGESTLLFGTAGAVLEEIDAVLTPGDEVFPNCEVLSACPQPPSGESLSPGIVGPPTTTTTVLPPVTRQVVPRPGPRCKKGYRRVNKNGHRRCVKTPRKQRHPRPHHLAG